MSLTAILLTACSLKEDVINNNKPTENNTTEQTQKEVKEEVIKHDLVQAKKTLSKYYYNEKEYAYAFLHLSSMGQDTKILFDDREFGTIKSIALAEETDLINEVETATYNDKDVINYIKESVNSNSFNHKGEFLLIEEDLASYSLVELQSKLSNPANVLYFVKNKVFVKRQYGGVGGVFPSPDTEENWQIEGDTIKIPFLSIDKSKIEFTVELKLNRKNYTGGKAKSMYYIATPHQLPKKK